MSFVRVLILPAILGVAGCAAVAWGQTYEPPPAPDLPPYATFDMPYVAPQAASVAPPAAFSRGLAEGVAPATECPDRTGSSFYARVDYLSWRETDRGMQFVAEGGALITLGYAWRGEAGRLRAELFGGVIDYDGYAMTEDALIPLKSKTGYFGFRAESDLLHEFRCDRRAILFAGLGTRLWNRDLRGGAAIDGTWAEGYHEVWWTVYPRIGMEFRQPLAGNREWFVSAAVGATVLTVERVSGFNATLYPKPGPVFQGELGWQGQRAFVSLQFELFNWAASDVVGEWQVCQPESTMISLGLNAGLRF